MLYGIVFFFFFFELQGAVRLLYYIAFPIVSFLIIY